MRKAVFATATPGRRRQSRHPLRLDVSGRCVIVRYFPAGLRFSFCNRETSHIRCPWLLVVAGGPLVLALVIADALIRQRRLNTSEERSAPKAWTDYMNGDE
jgi:hypothetical protein